MSQIQMAQYCLNFVTHVHIFTYSGFGDLCTDMVTQALELSSQPHVVVATPGRLSDHIRSSDTFSMARIKFLVRSKKRKLND